MLIFGCFAWWLSGVLTFAYLRRGECMTWGELVTVGFCMFGLLGPLVAFAIGFFFFCQLDFWMTPVCDTFKRKRKIGDNL